jgi:hypothetical protein
MRPKRRDRRVEHSCLIMLVSLVCLSPALRGRAEGPVALAEEFQVNTETANIQQTSSVALDRAGNFVVAWQSEIAGQGDEIRARRFAARGEALGGEIAVNEVSAQNQNAPALAMDGAGNFVIAWQSLIGGNFEIRARRFNAQGITQGGEISVSTRRGESQSAPAIAMSGSGEFVVVWEAPVHGDYEIRGRCFDAQGVPRTREIAINVETRGSQRFPAVAMNGAREFVVAFRSNVAGSYEIRARRFSTDGSARGDEIPVNAETRGDQLAPAVALEGRGNFVVAWENSLDDHFEVRTRRFSARDVPLGPELPVHATTTRDQFAPAIAIGARGAFVVAWHSQLPGDFEIRARSFAADGLAQGEEVAVNGVSAGTQKMAAVAANLAGDFVVTWHSDATGSWEIAARRYQAAARRRADAQRTNARP